MNNVLGPAHQDERPGLQALLRGANEARALLPVWSPRRLSAEVLADGLEKILSEDSESIRDGR